MSVCRSGTTVERLQNRERPIKRKGVQCYHQGVWVLLPSLANLNIMADPENQPEQQKAAPEKQIIGKRFFLFQRNFWICRNNMVASAWWKRIMEDALVFDAAMTMRCR